MPNAERPSWHHYYHQLAKVIAQAPDATANAGAVLLISKHHHLVATAYDTDTMHALEHLAQSATSQVSGTLYLTHEHCCDRCDHLLPSYQRVLLSEP